MQILLLFVDNQHHPSESIQALDLTTPDIHGLWQSQVVLS